jgi:hypothetical protein
VGLGRLELPTSRLSGVRSNQLSYRPVTAPPAKVRVGPVHLDSIRRDAKTAVAVCLLKTIDQTEAQSIVILRKEVIQPQVPLRLPCYDFTPVADLTVVGCLPKVSVPA